MNQSQQKGNDQAAQNRQYQYEQQQEKQQQSVPNRAFQFTFGKKQDIPKQLKMPRSLNYIEAVQAADLLSANDEAIIAKLKEKMDADSVDELSEMTAEETRGGADALAARGACGYAERTEGMPSARRAFQMLY